MIFLELCERAKCSPDFQAIHNVPDDKAAVWIAGRLARYGFPVYMPDIEAALKSDRERPAVSSHRVWPTSDDADWRAVEEMDGYPGECA